MYMGRDEFLSKYACLNGRGSRDFRDKEIGVLRGQAKWGEVKTGFKVGYGKS